MDADTEVTDAILKQANLRKLEFEIKLLADQLTPAYRRRQMLSVTPGTSGLILALVAVVGGIASAIGWFEDQHENREARTTDRMERALTLLSSGGPSQRAAAITALDIALSNDDQQRNRQVVISIANALPLETEPSVRNAMIWFFEDIDSQKVTPEALGPAIKSLAYASRVRLEDLQSPPLSPPSGLGPKAVRREPPAPSPAVHGADIPLDVALETLSRALTALLRKGGRYEDLSGVYLAGANLSGLDLSGMKFDRAVLADTNFRGATLQHSSFRGADLAGTNFASADLQHADFALRPDPDNANWGYFYVEQQIGAVDTWAKYDKSGASHQVDIVMPDFSCADLRDADFSGHGLFTVYRNELSGRDFYQLGPSFMRANLAGAKFDHVEILAISHLGRPEAPISTAGRFVVGQDFSSLKLGVAAYSLQPNSQWTAGMSDFSDSLRHISLDLAGTNWPQAHFPKAFFAWFSHGVAPPSRAQANLSCRPRAPF